jgi:hypothetical protein
MTDKTPERVWLLGYDFLSEGDDAVSFTEVEGKPEFIPHDLHLAAVAEAYEDVASFLKARGADVDEPIDAECAIVEAEAVLDLIPFDALAAREARDKKVREEALALAAAAMAHPEDAQAALEARDKQVREEALREAARKMQAQSLRADNIGDDAAANDFDFAERAILALIKGETYE